MPSSSLISKRKKFRTKKKESFLTIVPLLFLVSHRISSEIHPPSCHTLLPQLARVPISLWHRSLSESHSFCEFAFVRSFVLHPRRRWRGIPYGIGKRSNACIYPCFARKSHRNVCVCQSTMSKRDDNWCATNVVTLNIVAGSVGRSDERCDATRTLGMHKRNFLPFLRSYLPYPAKETKHTACHTVALAIVRHTHTFTHMPFDRRRMLRSGRPTVCVVHTRQPRFSL